EPHLFAFDSNLTWTTRPAIVRKAFEDVNAFLQKHLPTKATPIDPRLVLQVPCLEPDLKKVAVADGVELHYVEKGKGDAIIFLQGGTADYTWYVHHLDPLAEKGYRAIVYSRPYNYPNTNKLQAKYSYEIEADYLATLMNKLGLEKAHIVGHSNGGSVALCLAIKHPERRGPWTLAEPPIRFKGDPPVNEDLARRNKRMRELFAQGKPEEALFPSAVGPNPKGPPKMPEALNKLTLRNAQAMEAVVNSEPNEVDPEDVKKLKMPTLFLSGEVSGKFIPSLKRFTKELMKLIPEKNRQEVVIPGAHHGMINDNAEQSRKALLEFLKDK